MAVFIIQLEDVRLRGLSFEKVEIEISPNILGQYQPQIGTLRLETHRDQLCWF